VTASEVSGTPHGRDQLRIHAAAVLALLPQGMRPRVPGLAHILAPPGQRAGESNPHADSFDQSLGALITARSTSLLPREIGRFNDHVLPRLIDEMLHAPISDTRLYAAFLIRATPYREPVANALGWGISRIRRAEHPFLLCRFLEALRILGGAAERRLVEGLTDPRVPFQVQEAAFQALGHMGGTSEASFWQRSFACHNALASAGNSSGERLLNHAVYSVSMKRNITELRSFADDSTLAASVRAAAQWWLSLPTHMFVSAES